MIIVNNRKINVKMTLSILLKLYTYMCFQKIMKIRFPTVTIQMQYKNVKHETPTLNGIQMQFVLMVVTRMNTGLV